MSVWPVNPATTFLPHPPLPAATYSRPRVGLGVICRCQPNTVECLLLRRGPRFVSPLKWSFPGGRLGERGDLDDDGVKGTERELLKECGGGNPRGLPQLIHIECYKSQKTLYHVYVVDWEDQPQWLHWNPAKTDEHTGEIDTMATELQIQGHTFKAVEGFCWVSLHTLVEECMSIGTTDQDKINASDLQHGLIRWVIANGETILKILSARSPKLAHHKRHPSTSSSSPSTSSSVLTAPSVGNRGMGSGQFRPVAFFSKAKRYLAGSAGATGNDQYLLAPPLFPSQLLHPSAIAAASNQLTAANQGLSSGHSSSSGGGVYPMSQDFQSGLLTLQVPMGSGLFGGQQPSLLSQEQIALVQQQQQQQQQQPGRQSNGLPQQPNSMYIQPGVSHTASQVPGLVGASSGQGSTQNPPRPPTGNGEQSLAGYIHPESTLGEAGLTPGVLGVQGLPPQGFPATGGIATLPTVASTTHNNPTPSAHPSLGMDPAAVAAAGGTQHQPEGSALLSSPQVPTAISSVMQASRMTDLQSSAMGNSTLVGTQGEFGHVPGHTQGSPIRRQPPPTARYDICRHFLNGHCHYGDSCWFLHPEPPLYLRRRDPLLGPGGIMTNSPLPLPVGGTWMSSGSFMDHHVSQYGPQSPPQSPLGVVNPALNSTSWQMAAIAGAAVASGSRLPLTHANLGGAGGLPGHQMRPFMYPGGRFVSSHTQLPPSTITDPVLRFKLLSEVVMRDGNGSIVADISHLAVRADHFYSCFASTVRDYKVLFGGDRRCSDSHTLTAERSFNHSVSCIHSSKLLPSLLVVGTEDGSIFTWDLKKGGNNSVPVPVHEAEEEFEEPVTALVHFTTTIAGAQVVVSGNKLGVVSWYIAQPPMKTYIVLASRKFDTPNLVMSLQILGGYLIAGSKNGTVCMWSMRSQEPEFFSQFQAHSESLLDIHIIDSSSFLTVGVDRDGSASLPTLPSSTSTTSTTVTERVEATGQISVESTQATDAPPHTTVDTVSSELANLTIVPNSAQSPLGTSYSIQSSTTYNVCLWDFGKPVRKVKTQKVTGPVLSTNFHQQPMFGNRFLAMGLTNGAVKIYNLPTFTVASEIRFPDIENKDCIFVALNLSREKENTHHVNVKNPFRDLILTTVWSDGRIMVCQTDRKF